jgi:hypothetical protein
MVTRYGYFFNAACQFNTTTIEGFCHPTGCITRQPETGRDFEPDQPLFMPNCVLDHDIHIATHPPAPR